MKALMRIVNYTHRDIVHVFLFVAIVLLAVQQCQQLFSKMFKQGLLKLIVNAPLWYFT